MKKTLPVQMRQRILALYDEGHYSREEVARRFQVSLGMVKKLIQQRRHTGDIAPRHHRSGRKPLILGEHQRRMRVLLARKPDLTLAEVRASLSLECTLPAIHYALLKMGLSYKKKRCAPASKSARTSRGRGVGGAGPKEASSPRG